jgi:hypothetical protein
MIGAFEAFKQLYSIEREIHNHSSCAYLVCKTVATGLSIGIGTLNQKKENILGNGEDGRVIVPYYLHGHKYIILPKVSHGAQSTIHVSSNGENVSNIVLEYMGPNQDFHEMEITPETLGFDNLHFTVMDNFGDIEEYEFGEDDLIKVPKK